MEEVGSPYPVGPSLRHVKIDMASAKNSPRGGSTTADLPVGQAEAPVGGSREARHGKSQERWEGSESVRTWDGQDDAMLGGSVRTVEALGSVRTVEDEAEKPLNEAIDSSGMPRLGSKDDMRPPQEGMTALERVDLADLRDGCQTPLVKEKVRTFDTVCEADIADEAFGDGAAETSQLHDMECPLDACGSARSPASRADTNLDSTPRLGRGMSAFDEDALLPLLKGKPQVQSPFDRCVVIARASMSCTVILGAVLVLFLTSASDPFTGHVNSTSTAVPLAPTKGPIHSITTTVPQAIKQRPAVNSESLAPKASETLSLAIEVKKVNAQRLILDDVQSSAFEVAVSEAVAAVGGHGLRTEDVLLELSALPSGDVRADMTVSIPSKMSKHALAKRLSRQQLLSVALESQLAGVAGFHKVAADDVSVKVAAVPEPSDASVDASKHPTQLPIGTTPSLQPATAGGPHTIAPKHILTTPAVTSARATPKHILTTPASIASPAVTAAIATITPTSRVTPASVNEGLNTASPSTLPASGNKNILTTAPSRRPATHIPKATSGELATAATETPATTAFPASDKEGLHIAAQSPTPATPINQAPMATTPAAIQVPPIPTVPLVPVVLPTSQPSSWLDDYKKRLNGQGQTLAVQVTLSGGLDTSTLTKLQLHDLSSAMTMELSRAMGIDASDIQNLEGDHGQLSVTTSRWGVTLTANGRICLPMNVGIQDAVPVLTSQHVRHRLAAAMSELPMLQGAISRAGSIGSFTVSAGQSSEDLFSKLDRNLDKVLNVQEFSKAASNLLTPPFKDNEIAEVYHKLDVNHDGQLDSDEFFGRFSKRKLKFEEDPA